MQLSSDAQIPDGLPAAMTLLNENPRLGFRTWENTPYPGFQPAQSTTALGHSWSVASGTRWVSLSCEFGACGPMGLSPSSIGANFSKITIDPRVMYLAEALNWAFSGHHTSVSGAWGYGNWCGAGGSGFPENNTDAGCMFHDYCFYSNRLDATSMSEHGWSILSPEQQHAAQVCDQTLCNSEASVSIPWWDLSQRTANAEIRSFFHSYVPAGARCR
jgi:hypothetical protein